MYCTPRDEMDGKKKIKASDYVANRGDVKRAVAASDLRKREAQKKGK